MSNSIRVGLIGFGAAGKAFHAPFINILPEFHLVAIRTSKDEDIAVARLKYPEAKVVRNSEEIFSDPEINLVVIATPNNSHFMLAQQALMAGKHVVIDKPFTTTAKEASILINLASSKKKVLSVYQNRRWDSDYLTVKKIITNNLLGELVSYESHFDRFRNVIKKDAWKEEDLPGSGILYDLGSHLIDQALDLFGKPLSVLADIQIQRPGAKVPDFFELKLFYPAVKVKLSAGMLVRPPALKYLVTGLKGSFVKYGMDVQEETLKLGILPEPGKIWGEEPETIWGSLDTDLQGIHLIGKVESEKGDYRQYYLNVYDAVMGKAELTVTPEHAKTTIAIIELAVKSNAEKRILSLQ